MDSDKEIEKRNLILPKPRTLTEAYDDYKTQESNDILREGSRLHQARKKQHDTTSSLHIRENEDDSAKFQHTPVPSPPLEYVNFL